MGHQFEPSLQPIQTVLNTVDPRGNMGVLVLQKSHARLEFLNVKARLIDHGSDVAQVFQNEVIDIVGHCSILPQVGPCLQERLIAKPENA